MEISYYFLAIEVYYLCFSLHLKLQWRHRNQRRIFFSLVKHSDVKIKNYVVRCFGHRKLLILEHAWNLYFHNATLPLGIKTRYYRNGPWFLSFTSNYRLFQIRLRMFPLWEVLVSSRTLHVRRIPYNPAVDHILYVLLALSFGLLTRVFLVHTVRKKCV